MLQKGLIIRFQMTIEDWFAWDVEPQTGNVRPQLKSKFNSESFVPETFLL